ncbi:unnamed protein product, partial [Prorocentrum cordatum]
VRTCTGAAGFLPAAMPSPGALSPKVEAADLSGKVAIITGATRGIGKACAVALAKQGCNIVVAAKTTVEDPRIPGTIYSVADELTQLGVQALPVKVDMRNIDSIQECVRVVVEKFNRIRWILINNASALWWHTIVGTPMNKYDLITQINRLPCAGHLRHDLLVLTGHGQERRRAASKVGNGV